MTFPYLVWKINLGKAYIIHHDIHTALSLILAGMVLARVQQSLRSLAVYVLLHCSVSWSYLYQRISKTIRRMKSLAVLYRPSLPRSSFLDVTQRSVTQERCMTSRDQSLKRLSSLYLRHLKLLRGIKTSLQWLDRLRQLKGLNRSFQGFFRLLLKSTKRI